MKRLFSLGCALLLLTLLLTGCGKGKLSTAEAGMQLAGPQDGDTIVIFETEKGTFKAVLFPEQAPLAVANFIELAEKGYYDGLIFHRVVEEFVIQTGDPSGTGSGGEAASGTPFANEYSDALHHFNGALGMANATANENGSQFYVVQGAPVSENLLSQMEAIGFSQTVIDNYKAVGGTPTLDNRYTVFGQVYEGLDVIAKINQVKTDDSDRPLDDVKLIKVTIETYSAAS